MTNSINDEELLDLLALHNISGLSDKVLFGLLEQCDSPSRILLELRKGMVSSARKSTAFVFPDKDEILRQLDKVKDLGITIVPCYSHAYPVQLRHLTVPPPILYVRGKLSIFLDYSISVVGTRAFSEYGKKALTYLLPPLVKQGISIVSGLAIGIDALAHKIALESEGYTLAVLGSGIDVIAPVQNASVCTRIMETGAVISDFPIGTQPTRYTFPKRNRIIAALSKSVLIVEAGRRSGSLITADYALDMGREVFAVPGSMFSNTSLGTNRLISMGARIVTGIEDLLQEYDLMPYENAGGVIEAFDIDALPLVQRKILKTLGGGGLEVDELIERLDYGEVDVLSSLTQLELQGVIKRDSGDRVILARKIA